jgi:hypothetical protein
MIMNSFIIHFPAGSQLQHRTSFGVSVITRSIEYSVEFLCTGDQLIAEASTYTGQHKCKHKRQTTMPRAGFEPAIPAKMRPQIYAFDLAATGICMIMN